MLKKFLKDRNHNRYAGYCCEDIDPRLQALEEAVAALVAGTVPDGAVTLAKLAADARSYVREINKGRLLAEWVGSQAEYDAHVAENGGNPLPNVKYIITDDVPLPPDMAVKLGVRNAFKESGYYYIEARSKDLTRVDALGLVYVRVGGQEITHAHFSNFKMTIDNIGGVELITENGENVSEYYDVYARRVTHL